MNGEFIGGTKWPLRAALIGNKVLKTNLEAEDMANVVPDAGNVFKALELTAPEDVKVLIIGQDPYINGEAHGLAFSSPMKMTPSLKIIFAELDREYGFKRQDTDLTSWAKHGVLLLNTILTTRRGQTLAHVDFGWQDFTREVVKYLLSLNKPLVVMLWGRHAVDFWDSIPAVVRSAYTLTLRSVHPQAENYNKANKFTGNGHFQEANNWLISQDIKPINWIS